MRSRVSLALLFCLLASMSQLAAQESRGTIAGSVLDPSGAVVPGAQVVVVNTAMGTRVVLRTNTEGRYAAPLLIPGLYTVEVEAPGFKKAVRENLEVRVADRLDISFSLEIGAAGEAVTVTAEAPLLNSESASLGTVVDSRRLASLPVSYGNPFLLIGLTAGVTFNGSARLDRPFEPTHIVNFSMGGTRGNLNDITIDGAPTTATAGSNEVTASYVPPTDVVQEFKVQTATFDAQFGQTQGGVTNISIKSGTNEFRGTAGYSIYRPSLLANDFFNNKAGLPVPNFRFDRWGGSLGGPVRIPKVYDGRNRTFFMWGYEGLHDARPRHDDTTNTVPTPAMHTGDFSALLLNGGAAYTIYDPATRVRDGARFRQTPFPGNIVPPGRISAVGAALISYYPKVEKTPGDPLGLNNYRDASLPEKTKYYNYTIRGDQNVSDKQRFFLRYSTYIRNSTYNNYFDNAFMGIRFWFKSYTAMLDHVYTLSPTMVLNTRYSFNRFIRGQDSPESAVGFDITKLGFSSQYASQVPKDIMRFPRITYASTSYIANAIGGHNRPINNHTVSATLSKVAGKHSIRTGFEFRAYQEIDGFFGNNQTGAFVFGSTWTRGPLDNSATSPSGYGQSIAALLLGLPDSGQIVRASNYAEQSDSWGFFVQDDWKVTRELTFNMGLRYEFETPMRERYHRSTLSFDPLYEQPISAAAKAAYATLQPAYSGGFPELPVDAFALRGGMTFAGVDGNPGGLYKTPKNVFMPRVGLAYQLGSKTVIRSGFGMFGGFLGQRRGDVLQNGFTQNTNMVLTVDNGLTWATTIANPFHNGVAEPRGNADRYQTFLGQGFSFFNQNPKVPMTLRWEIGIQREIAGFAVETNYVGSKTNRMEVTRNINGLPRQFVSTQRLRDDAWNNYLTATVSNPMVGLVPGNTQAIYTGTTTNRGVLLSPYRAFGSSAINTTENIGYSWYHGLQMSGQRRFTRGYTISGSYTFAKWRQAVNLLNASDPMPIREISDADAPHRFNVSAVTELPFGRGKPLLAGAGPVVSRLVGGWQLSGIWTLQSGFPLAWGNNIYYGDPANIRRPLSERTTAAWFNVAGFETASARQLHGNQLRWWPFRFGTLRRQRINNIDLAVIKDTAIAEGKSVQFRAEALNAFNHPYFPSPLMTVTTPQTAGHTGFGQINASTQDNYARRIQISLRFIF